MSTPATLREIRERIASGSQSAVDVCREALAAIERVEPALHAFNTVIAEKALARAAEIDGDPARWRNLPLAGVPVALKDNMCTRGVRTTASSKILENFVPPYDATVVTRLEAAGAVIVGKTNCDEFSMGSSTENSAFGPSRNPWATDRIPGGSSGGSAVAVSASGVPLAFGSDTGGSIRQPAAMCGVLGLKPTYGRVSRYGLIAFGSSLDQIGPITRTAHDAALALRAVAGADPADATSSHEPVPDYAAALTGDIKGLRIGVPRAILKDGVDADISAAVDEALDVLAARGAKIEDVALPHASHGIPAYYIVATAEASSNLARYDGVRYGHRAANSTELHAMYEQTRAQGFGTEVKRRIMLGTYVLSAGYYDAYYLKAQQVRTLIRQDYEKAFHNVDVIAMPTSPVPPFKIGERSADPLQMYLADIFTVSAPLAGLPALSVPCGFTPGRLPVGLQLTGRRFDEATLLKVADAYERDTQWATQVPPARLTPADWATATDEALLALRMCDLGLSMEGTAVAQRIATVNAELEARGLALPHYWLSDEWFTPDGIPGVAVPFYLAHPRLEKLELTQMLEVEGGDEASCMKILRHEAGHAIDNAYDLRRFRVRRKLFGSPTVEYPEYYTPKPYSKSFVQHLDHWYAQSHPDEDFAETFAVWLEPDSGWAARYAGWPVARKLEYLDHLMKTVAHKRPRLRTRREVDPLPKLRKTLGEHYRRKREHYGLDHPHFYDSDLHNLFSNAPEYAKRPSAARFVRKVRREVRSTVASFTDSYQYTIDQLIQTIVARCRAENLRLTDTEEATKIDFMVFLTVQTMNYLHSGRHRVAL